jgi:hypothetical protein
LINSSLRQRQSGAASFLHFLNSCGGGLDVKEPTIDNTLIQPPNQPLNHNHKISCALNHDSHKISRALNHDDKINSALNRGDKINCALNHANGGISANQSSSDPRRRRRITIRDDFAIYDINVEANCRPRRHSSRDTSIAHGVRANGGDHRYLGAANGDGADHQANLQQAERYG